MFEKVSSESNLVDKNLKPRTVSELSDIIYGESEQLETGENFESAREYPSTFDDATPGVKDVFAEYWNDLSISERDDAVIIGADKATEEQRKEFFDEKFKKLESLLDPELPDNVHEMETDWANIRLIYERHGQQMPVSTVIGLDVICAEVVLDDMSVDSYKYWQQKIQDEDIDYVEMEPISLGVVGDDKNDAIVMAALKDLQIPIALNDIHGDEAYTHGVNDAIAAENLNKKIHTTAKVMIPAALLLLIHDLYAHALDKKYINHLEDSKELDRRGFLKLMRNTAAVGAASTLNLVDFASNVPNEKKSIYSKMNKLHTQTLESIGYGQFVTHFRNALMAQKIYVRAQDFNKDKENNGKKPYIGMQLGAMHTGIEQMLEMSEKDRLEIIEKGVELLLIQDIEFDASFYVESVFDNKTESWKTSFLDNSKIQEIVQRAKNSIMLDQLDAISNSTSSRAIRDIVNEARIK